MERNKGLIVAIIVLFFVTVTGLLGYLAFYARDYIPFMQTTVSDVSRSTASVNSGGSGENEDSEALKEKSGESEPEGYLDVSGEQSDKPPEESHESSGKVTDGEQNETSGKSKEQQQSSESGGDPSSGSPGNEIDTEPTKPEAEEQEQKAAPVAFNKPDEMRAVILTPGVDFDASGTAETIKTSIDTAIDNARSLMMNTIIMPLFDENGRALYQSSDVKSATNELDILEYMVKTTHSNGMYSYVILMAKTDETVGEALPQQEIDSRLVERSGIRAADIAKRYSPDGIMIDSYENPSKPSSYAQYIRSKEGMGFNEYQRSRSEALYRSIYSSVKSVSPRVQVGPVVNAVWENKAANEQGSNTSATKTSLSAGNVDTKRIIEALGADFFVVSTNGAIQDKQEPFKEVISWWSGVSGKRTVPFYAIQRSSVICTPEPGFSSPDELVQELVFAREQTGFEGSIFDSMSRLSENPQTSTDLLLKLYSNDINVEHLLTRLAVTKPEQQEFSTLEPVMVFRGASDPNFEVTLDKNKLETDENGYFSVSVELKAGENVFNFLHKDQTVTFKITRNVQILKEISPQNSITLDGGMKLEITALAYSDAKVSAKLGSNTVSLTRDDSASDDTDADSAYSRFVGSIQMPTGTENSQSLGSVVVFGEWQGLKAQLQGAAVTINEVNKTEVIGGELVEVSAESAKTFPANVLNNESSATCYPLPKGTRDYLVGDMQTFKNASGTYHYYTLQSGVRVYAEDVNTVSGSLTPNNAITGMKITSDSKYTYVALDTAEKVPYSVSASQSALSFKFMYTTSVPGSAEVSGNPIFSGADWSGSTLTLPFVKQGSFLGYHAYYKDRSLVLRFINPPLSLSSLRVAIDPGHGGKDSGALGFYPDVNEAQLTAAIAEKTAAALSAKGAQVKLIPTTPYLTLNQRLDSARAFEADVLISIHGNSSVNASAKGSEAYYLYQNSQPLASAISKQVAAALESDNRGAKQSSYWVTADSHFAAVLVECGFVSNQGEYKKLVNDKYQTAIADGIAKAVESYAGALSTGISGGSDSTHSADSAFKAGEQAESGDGEVFVEPDENVESSTPDDFWADSSDSEEDESITVESSRVQLIPAEVYQIKFETNPKNANVIFEPGDNNVAMVNSDGVITAIDTGKTRITMRLRDNPDVSVDITVTVN